MFNLTKEEIKLFKSLNTPNKIQDFIDKIPINFEEKVIHAILQEWF